MRSRARIFRHPLHPMLVVFPTAIFPLLLFLDVLRALGAAIGPSVPFWLAVAGVATTLAAIVPGVIDLAAIPDRSRAHRVAFVHFVVGTVTLAAYAAAAWTRWPAGPDRVGLALGIDVVGVLLVGAQGFLGGELVYRHHLGVLKEAEGAEPTDFEPPGAAPSPRHGAIGEGARRR